MLLLAAVLTGLLSTPPSCWDVYDAAMQRSAQAAQPRFVSYDEDIRIKEYGNLVASRVHVFYRYDGEAIVQDDRYGPKPVFTTQLDPGPPLLGPYGASKAGWLARDAPELRTIADVRVDGGERCENAGVVQVDGLPAFHVIFHHRHASSAGLKELWVDAHTSDILRLIVSGPLKYAGTDSADLTDFDVRLTTVDGYSVVSHVSWWQGFLVGDYTFENFAFPSSITAFDGF